MITPDQRLFLLASPALDLPFGRDRFFYALKLLMEDEN
jgi:hypothetical protein